MFWVDLVFVVVIAILLTALFAGGLRRPGPWAGWGWFFLIVLLGGWLAALWVQPIGPPIWGVAWLPILWVALLVALLLAAASPPPARTTAEPPPVEGEAAAAGAVAALGVFFYMMIFGLLIAIVVGYLV